MSITVMARVWAKTQHSGAHLLMMLAIADFADEQGIAYPSVATLARKCRVQSRAANYTISVLKSSGELDVRLGAGPRGTNLYRIMLGQGVPLETSLHPAAGGLQCTAPLQSVSALHPNSPLQFGAHTPATDCLLPLQPIADKPSMNHHEPKEATASSMIPPCPYDRLIDIYHEICPTLPRVRKTLFKTGQRSSAMRSRWAWVMTATAEVGEKTGQRIAETTEEGIAWFRKFFEHVAKSAFLLGQASTRKWSADLGWLMRRENFEKVLEGNYHREVSHA